MRIALLLKQDAQENVTSTTGQAVIFNVINNRVVGVENETLELQKVHQLSVWAVGKRISELYMPEVSDTFRKICNKMGVTVNDHDELSNNHIFKNYIL